MCSACPTGSPAWCVSCQHDADKDLEDLRQEILECVITPAARTAPGWGYRAPHQSLRPLCAGRLEADTGLTSRKLMVDTYGGLIPPRRRRTCPGKDGTKVDRGAYMAPTSPRTLWPRGWRRKCTVSLAYAIGREPSRWRWTSTPMAPACTPVLCWSRLSGGL